MIRVCHLAVWLSLALLLSSTVLAQRSTYDPSAKQQRKPHEGFVDFALNKINPENIDYGREIGEARKLAVDQTIKSIDSWALLITLCFLVLAFFMLMFQHRESNRRETITAEILAQYHNAWVDARAQAEEAIRRHNALVHTTNGAAEAALRLPLPDTDRAQARPVKPDVRGDLKPPSVAAAATSSVKTAANGGGRNDSDQDLKPAMRQNREPEVDLIAQISTLQQQLNASHEREKNLQKELNKTQRRTPAALPRDANLPG